MEEQFYSEKELIKELQYLHLEGFLEVKFHPEYPGCYMNALLRMKSQEEIAAELEAILNS